MRSLIFFILTSLLRYYLQVSSPILVVSILLCCSWLGFFCFFCLFVFAMHKLFSLMYSYSNTFAFTFLAFGNNFTKTPLRPRSLSFSVYVFFYAFNHCSLIVKSLIHLEMCVCVVSFAWDVPFFQHHLLKRFFCPGSCHLLDWVVACKSKGYHFNFQPGHLPCLWARYPVGGMWDATRQWCFSPLYLPPFPSL